MQCSSAATYINTNKKCMCRRRDTILTIIGSTLRLTLKYVFVNKRVFFQTRVCGSQKKIVQNDPKSYAMDLRIGGPFSNKFIQKTVAKKDIVFNSSKNQVFEISNGFRGRRREQFWDSFVTNCLRKGRIAKIMVFGRKVNDFRWPGRPRNSKSAKKNACGI